MNPKPFKLIGPRLQLRRLTQTDLVPFQSYRSDPEVGKFQSWEPMSDAQAERFLAITGSDSLLSPDSWCQIAIALAPGEPLVGDLGIHINREQTVSEIGFTLARPHWGNGYATEAVTLALTWVFTQTTVSKVIAITDAENTRSSRVLKKVGMKPVKTYATEFRGEPCMETQFEIHRSAFDADQG